MSDERSELLKEYLAKRAKALADIGTMKHMLTLFEETIKTADRGLRQQQSASIDQILSEIVSMKTMLSSIHHDLLEEPPE